MLTEIVLESNSWRWRQQWSSSRSVVDFFSVSKVFWLRVPDWKDIAPRIRKRSACTSNLSASPRPHTSVRRENDWFFSFLFLFPMAARAGGNSFLQLVAGVHRRSSCILYREKTSHFGTSNVEDTEEKDPLPSSMVAERNLTWRSEETCNARNQTSRPWVGSFSQRIQSVKYANSRGPHAWSSAWHSTVGVSCLSTVG